MEPIRTVAAVITNSRGEVLLVRKRSSSIFIQPGGKAEPNEQLLSTLARELNEELGVELDIASAVYLGEFEDVAVNEPGRRVRANAFACSISGIPAPQAEIEELAWVKAGGPYDISVAPLSASHILPAFVASASGKLHSAVA
jgi:8-oxo-dGTP diphosphatase